MALSPEDEVEIWATSGAMALTAAPSGRSVGPPLGLVPKLHALNDRLSTGAAALGGTIAIDPLTLLAERAAITRLRRGGIVSCGGGSRLLRCDDRWLAVTLARLEDEELVPAWLGVDEPTGDPWAAVTRAVAAGRVADVMAQGLLLGLPLGLLPEDGRDLPAISRIPVAGPAPAADRLAELVVVDLSSLWAGPLCASLLAEAGATVVKVESGARPDGARRGPVTFFDLLNAGKQGVAVDLRSAEGVQALRDLVAAADIVIEASRPRALEQLGIDARVVLTSDRPRVWASITGHGRQPPGRDRVAFGDDAAVAGGLVGWGDDRPLFCGDAIADPLSGMMAAVAILDALRSGGRWLLDISMAGVAAHFRGPTIPLQGWHGDPAPPRARIPRGRGPQLGEHTADVLGAVLPRA